MAHKILQGLRNAPVQGKTIKMGSSLAKLREEALAKLAAQTPEEAAKPDAITSVQETPRGVIITTRRGDVFEASDEFRNDRIDLLQWNNKKGAVVQLKDMDGDAEGKADYEQRLSPRGKRKQYWDESGPNGVGPADGEADRER